MSLTSINSSGELKALPAFNNGLLVISFWAPWSQPSVQTNNIMLQLQNQHKNITFVQVEAEEVGDVTEAFGVDSVPCVLFLQNGKVVDTLKGSNPPVLTQKVSSFGGLSSGTPAAVPDAVSLNDRLKALINQHPVMAFIKGSPSAPQCGYTRKFCALLDEHNIKFGSFNILADQQVREGLKKYSNWPTYPQLYVHGELVGGLDIVTELLAAGELQEMIKGQ
eukprot:TRINITY_DN14384_c0_g1_i1.p1 TRINITY_DN14384_c0_g1~~TRINITY_DN14384_c0_g1_i1.p1  ORF type:complete len:221 (-),score=57.01 TRINITY_DN14384_c0_g1_i1:263-925(-)